MSFLFFASWPWIIHAVHLCLFIYLLQEWRLENDVIDIITMTWLLSPIIVSFALSVCFHLRGISIAQLMDRAETSSAKQSSNGHQFFTSKNTCEVVVIGILFATTVVVFSMERHIPYLLNIEVLLMGINLLLFASLYIVVLKIFCDDYSCLEKRLSPYISRIAMSE
jgi:hypothetical protein